MVNHAQDLMSVKKFLDLPNKLIPNRCDSELRLLLFNIWYVNIEMRPVKKTVLFQSYKYATLKAQSAMTWSAE